MQGKLKKKNKITNAQQARSRIYTNARKNYYKQMRSYDLVRFVILTILEVHFVGLYQRFQFRLTYAKFRGYF